jgi:hypothetical protein
MNLAAHRRIWLVAALMALTASANGDTLVFVPQWDNINSRTNYSWFFSANWFIPDEDGELDPAGRVPHANDDAIITSLVDVEATDVRVVNLLLTNNAVVSNGTFSVSALRMLSASSFQNSSVNILVSLNVGGTNCSLNGTFMEVLSFAYATFAPVAPAAASTLTLARGSVFQDSGKVTLAGGSQIIAGSPPQSTLIIKPGAVLSATDLTYIEGSAAGHLIVDNSGLIRADGGTLRFDNGIDWRCSAGTGEFRAASTNSLILFASGFHADGGTTNLFTGPGTNRWSSSGSIDGTAQVGTPDPTALSTGNLEILSSYSGSGNVHVLGNSAQTAALNWSNGTLSLAVVNIDTNAIMRIGGGAGTSRQLSGCALNNSGICSILSGDLTLAQGSVLQNSGRLFLDGGSPIIAGSLPQSKLIIKPGAVLSATNLTSIEGSAAGHLIVDNSGLIRADGGTLRFDNGIDWRCSAGTGEFRAASTDSLILFASGFHADGGTTSLFTGPGTNCWPSSGTNVINGTAQVGALDPNTRAFSTGNLEIFSSCSGAGSVHVLGDPAHTPQTGVLNWKDGTLSLAAINIDPWAIMQISGGAGTSLQLSGCALNNGGATLLLDQATITCGSGATLLNRGTLDIQTDAALTFSNASPMLVIINSWQIVKSAGTQTSLIAANFYNSGTIEVKAGTLQFQGSWSQTAGSSTVDSGAVLGGTVLTNGGGTLAGNGTIQAKVVNGGVTSPGGSPGTLSLGPGEDYQQGTNGILRIEIGGHNPGTEYDQLVVGGNASLAGTLELHLINGFVPQPGDEFEILTCGSQTGQFSQINAPAVSGAVWVAHYNGTNVSVALASGLNPVLSGGMFSFSFGTTAGRSYLVQASDSLDPSNWQTLEQIAGDGSPKTISDPATGAQRFYRVLIQ